MLSSTTQPHSIHSLQACSLFWLKPQLAASRGAPGLLPHTVIKAPAAFANSQLFESLTINDSVSHNLHFSNFIISGKWIF